MWLSWKFINEVNCSRKSTTWLSSIMLGSSHVPVHFHYCTHFLGFCHGRFVHEMWSLAFHWKLFQPWFLHSVTSFGQVSHELIIAFYASQQLRNLIDFIHLRTCRMWQGLISGKNEELFFHANSRWLQDEIKPKVPGKQFLLVLNIGTFHPIHDEFYEAEAWALLEPASITSNWLRSMQASSLRRQSQLTSNKLSVVIP